MNHLACAAALAALAVASAAQAGGGNLLVNGSFEDPGAFPGGSGRDQVASTNGASPGQAQVGGYDIPGWSYNGLGYAVYETNADGVAPADGSYYISMGHVGLSGEAFSQTVDTVAGSTYVLNYEVTEQQALDPTQDVSASISGAYSATVYNTNIGGGFVQGASIMFTSTGGPVTITLTDLLSTGSANVGIDNVCFGAGDACGRTYAGPSNGLIGAASAPEPATWALILIGVGTAGAGLRRRRAAGLTAA